MRDMEQSTICHSCSGINQVNRKYQTPIPIYSTKRILRMMFLRLEFLVVNAVSRVARAKPINRAKYLSVIWSPFMNQDSSSKSGGSQTSVS